MDKTDIKILNSLKENSKRSVRDISRVTGIPSTTIHSRVSKLKKGGIIKRFTIDVDMEKLGRKTSAYIMLLINPNVFRNTKQLENKIIEDMMKNPIVEEAALITGNRDVIIKVCARDMNELSDFIVRIRSNEMVIRSETLVVLNSTKQTAVLGEN